MRLRTALSLEGEWMPIGARQSRRSVADDPVVTRRRRRPARRRWTRHRDRSGACAGHRPAAPRPVPGAGRRGRQRRPGRFEEDRGVRRRTTDRGWCRCGWSRKASTSLAYVSACSPPRHRPSCSSARRSAASCAGRRGARTRRRTSTSPTTLVFERTRSRSPKRAATSCVPRATGRRRLPGGRRPRRPEDRRRRQSSSRCSTSSLCCAPMRPTCRPHGRRRRCGHRRRRTRTTVRPAPTSSRRTTPAGHLPSTTSPTRPRRSSRAIRTSLLDLPDIPTAAGLVPTGSLSVAEMKDDLRTRNAHVAKRLVDVTGWNHPRVQGEMNNLAGV